MQKAILYLRYSTPEQSEGQSEQRQIQGAERWCKEHDARLVKCYKDLGISGGKSQEDRKGLAALLNVSGKRGASVRRAWGGATVGAWSENATDAGRVAMARGCSVSAHPGPSARVGGRPGVIADPWGQAAAGAAGGRGFQHSGSRASIWVMFMDGRRRSTSVRYS